MWTEPNMEGIQVFYDVSRGGPTEVEVQQTMWANFATNIVKRTVEGFGSVSGANQNKVPQ
jgi:hypothetical protein